MCVMVQLAKVFTFFVPFLQNYGQCEVKIQSCALDYQYCLHYKQLENIPLVSHAVTKLSVSSLFLHLLFYVYQSVFYLTDSLQCLACSLDYFKYTYLVGG